MITTLTHSVDQDGDCIRCGKTIPFPNKAKGKSWFRDGDEVAMISGEYCGTHTYFTGNHNTSPDCKDE